MQELMKAIVENMQMTTSMWEKQSTIDANLLRRIRDLELIVLFLAIAVIALGFGIILHS